MPILMKPVTFGCDNGFQEIYYDSESPTDDSKIKTGNIFCYLGRLSDEDKKSSDCLKKCMSMKAGECWKA